MIAIRVISLIAAINLLSASIVLDLSSPTVALSSGDSGTIAYFRRSTDEVRLIQLDGTNDRKRWTARTTNSLLGVAELEWRPDGGALAFSTDQENLCSVYDGDVYNSATATDGGTLLVSPAAMCQRFGGGPPICYDGVYAHDLKWLPDCSGFLFTAT